MPLYEYQCDRCSEVTEVMQKFSDAPLTDCGCGGRLTKLISRGSFVLNGTGWYTTDYKRAGTCGSGEKKGPAATPCGSQCSSGACS